jgi:hypothetical protein
MPKTRLKKDGGLTLLFSGGGFFLRLRGTSPGRKDGGGGGM